jgi:hypothetical protein
MFDTGLKWLSFFIGSGVLIYVFRLIFSSGKYCKTIEALEKEGSESSKKLDSLILSFNRLISKLENIKNISGLGDIYFKTASPNTLTEIGVKMLNDSGLRNFIDTNKTELIKKAKEHKSPTNYDIEQISRDIMLSLRDDPRINTTKEYAFQNGKDLTLMLMASGLYLRDLVISEQQTANNPEQKK